MNPELPRLPILPNLIHPPEMIEAAKSVKRAADAAAIAADKFAQVADSILSWDALIVFGLGLLLGVVLKHALTRTT